MKAFKSQEGKEAVLNYYNMLLKNLNVPYEELNIKTRYGNTSILTAGDTSNEPIILLHGSSMNSAMWIGDINELAKRYRVYALDMPGEPGKSCEDQLPFDTLDYSNWLLDIFNELSIKKANVVGASLGAWLGAKFTIVHPELVSKLVLLCPAGIGSQNHEFKDIALSLLSKGESGLDELLATINGDDSIPEIILNYQKLIAIFFNARQEAIPTFSDEELMRITMPCLVFVGAKDIMLRSDETRERVIKLLPNPKVVMLHKKGHSLSGLADEIMIFLEN